MEENEKNQLFDNLEVQNQPQNDPILTLNAFLEQLVDEVEAFKNGQKRFVEFAKCQRDVLSLKGINVLSYLQAELLFFKARNSAVLYGSKLDEAQKKLDYVKKILTEARGLKLKFVGTKLIAEGKVELEENRIVKEANKNIDEIEELLKSIDSENVDGSADENLDESNEAIDELGDNEISDKETFPESTNKIPEVENAKVDDGGKIPEKDNAEINDDNKVPEVENAKVDDGGKIPEKDNAEINDDNKVPEVENAEVDDDDKPLEDEFGKIFNKDENTTTQKNEKMILEDCDDSADVVDESEFEIKNIYKIKNGIIDLLAPENAELVYGIYKEESFNDAFNTLLDIAYCFPLSITTLPNEAISELKSHNLDVVINEQKKTITTFSYLLNFCATSILNKYRKNQNVKNLLIFYKWVKSLGVQA